MCEVLEERIISKGLWAPLSPHLSNCDFYFWGNLKGELYTNNPSTAETLQNKTMYVIASMCKDGLQNALENLFTCCEACLRTEGGHFQ